MLRLLRLDRPLHRIHRPDQGQRPRRNRGGDVRQIGIGLSVYATNQRGVRAYEKVGFKQEGRRRSAQFVGGRFVDVIEMGLLHDELIEP